MCDNCGADALQCWTAKQGGKSGCCSECTH